MWSMNVRCRTTTKSWRQARRRRRLMMVTVRKSDLRNVEATSVASVVPVTATVRQLAQQAPVTPVYIDVRCTVDDRVSSWSAPVAPPRPTSHSTDSTVSPASAAQPASVHASLASQDQSIMKTSSLFLPLSVS